MGYHMNIRIQLKCGLWEYKRARNVTCVAFFCLYILSFSIISVPKHLRLGKYYINCDLILKISYISGAWKEQLLPESQTSINFVNLGGISAAPLI